MKLDVCTKILLTIETHVRIIPIYCHVGAIPAIHVLPLFSNFQPCTTLTKSLVAHLIITYIIYLLYIYDYILDIIYREIHNVQSGLRN